MRNRTLITKWNLLFHYSSTKISIINGLSNVPFYLKFIDHGILEHGLRQEMHWLS